MNAGLQRFCELSAYTTPSEHASLYTALPSTLPELCFLIKQQFIHPSQIKSFGKAIPFGRKNEDGRFTTVTQMLQVLLERNPAGLVEARAPEQCLVVSCRHHALLLASILKVQGTPARVRVGFAEYVSDQSGKKIDHWICEVWHVSQARWMLVDPDLQRVDFPPAEFELAGDVWLRARAGTAEPQHYGCALRLVMVPIRDNLCHDFEAVFHHESNYREGPPLFHAALSALQPPQLVLLDFMAEWLQNPDVYYDELARLRAERPEFRR